MRIFGVLRERDRERRRAAGSVVAAALVRARGEVELSAGEKLMLLRELSSARRIELVHELLEHAVLAARRVRRAAERAATNGKVDLG